MTNSIRGSLSLAELQRIAIDLTLGKPPSIKGIEADRVRASFTKQIADGRKNGQYVDMQSEIPDFDQP